MLLTGVLWIAGAVLCAAGVGKLLRPTPTARALEAAGLPASRLAARVLGLVEATVAVDVLLVGGVPGRIAMAVLYLGFALFVALMIRRRPDAPCGCFGNDTSPPTSFHLWFNALTGLVVGVTLLSGPAPISLSEIRSVDGAVLVVVAATGAFLAIALISGVAQPVTAAGRQGLFRSVG